MKQRLVFLVFLSLLAGCSTVEDRIKEKPYAYAQLSAADQALIRSGQARAGFTQDQVYLAWGSPDRVRTGFRNGHPYQAWIYTTYRTVYTGYYYPAYARFGFYNYDHYWPGFHYRYGFYDPFFGPYEDFASVEVPYKTAFFEGNRLTGWEYLR
jgi:uncharacterized protein YceK